MRRLTCQMLVVLSSLSIFSSCIASKADSDYSRNGKSRVSSIVMPIPDKLKPIVGFEKINAYSLSISPGNCDSGVSGSRVAKELVRLELSGGTLANEKLKQGCAYTLIISLGKMDASGLKLEKIYLTNDLEGQRTEIPIEKTRVPKIKVTALLYVTEDGKKDLSIDDQAMPVLSTGESDADITIDIAQSGSDYDWRTKLQMTEVPESPFSGDFYGSAFYKDVMEHTIPSKRDFQVGPSTHAHETLHGLHNYMRNKTPANDGFFYLEKGRGAYVLEPKDSLTDVRNHIGESFKQMAQLRFRTYLVEQAYSWKNVLYLFDEWNAYVATTRSAVEIKRAGRWDNSNADPIEGVVDFMYFSSASLISIKSTDPEFLASNSQFKGAFAMIMEESVRWMNEAKKETLWSNSQAWTKMSNFQTAADAAAVRQAVKDLMGDAWTKRVLGF